MDMETDGRAGLRGLLTYSPSGPRASLLISSIVYITKLAVCVIGLRIPKPARPVVPVTQFSQDAVLLLRPPGQLVEVGVEILARGGYLLKLRQASCFTCSY